MVGGEHHVGIVGRQAAEELAQARVAEPREGDGAIGRFVRGQFAHHATLSAGVAEDVDEVDHRHTQIAAAHLVVGRQPLVYRRRIVEFVVGKGGSAVQARKLTFQEFGLVQVLALFRLLIHPQIGVRARNVERHHAGKERVACILGGGG